VVVGFTGGEGVIFRLRVGRALAELMIADALVALTTQNRRSPRSVPRIYEERTVARQHMTQETRPRFGTQGY
jgi:hypothetical protein